MHPLNEPVKGNTPHLQPNHSLRSIALAWLGGFLAVSALVLLSQTLSVALVLGSFGSSCLLLFAYPHAPFAQPRNVIVGHCLGTVVGLGCLTVLGSEWWAVAFAVSTAIALMMWTRTVHPPAASNPIMICLLKPTWMFLLCPTLLGAVVIVLIALAYNNWVGKERYPKYW